MNRRTQKTVWESIGKPLMRGSICALAAVAWWLFAAYLFLDFFPINFGFYNTLITNIGTNNNDVFFFGAWVPTLGILVFGGIFWAGGLFEQIEKIMEKLS